MSLSVSLILEVMPDHHTSYWPERKKVNEKKKEKTFN